MKKIPWLIITLLFFMPTSCLIRKVRINPPGSATIHILGLPGNCYTTRTGATQIQFHVVVKSKHLVSVIGGTMPQTIAIKAVNSSTGTVKFPLDITIDNLLNEQITYDVFIDGMECSTCANGRSNGFEVPYGTCPLAPAPGGSDWVAAKPTWLGSYAAPILPTSI